VRRFLLSDKRTWWQNAIGCLAAPLIVPVAIVAAIVMIPFNRPIERSAEEVAASLRDFLEGTGDGWDWDDFTSIQIADPDLDSIRGRATRIPLPLTEEGLATMQQLLEEAEALAGEELACYGVRTGRVIEQRLEIGY
jgi:hypothetical protein